MAAPGPNAARTPSPSSPDDTPVNEAKHHSQALRAYEHI